MLSALKGRHAVVTGGGRGIGAAVADALATAGARITLMGRSEGPMLETAERFEGAYAVVCDVTDTASVNDAFEQARSLSGPVEILVNNAGAAVSVPFASMSDEEWDSMLDVNLSGVFRCTRAVVGDMTEKGWGRIVTVASTAGQTGYPYVAGYCAAKHGAIGMTRALALELARTGVTVNAVCPGFTETEMLEVSLQNIVAKTGRSLEDARKALVRSNPQGRFVTPQEVADAVVWLCGDAAGAMNGQAIAVAGGEIMS